MTTTAPEAGAQQTTTDQAAAAAGAGAAAAGQQAAGTQQTPEQIAAAAAAAGGAAGAGAAAAGTGDELTPEEEAALGDPGKRALARVKEERNTLRTEHTTVVAERDQLRTQLQAAMQQIAAGGDQAQQQALQTVTTERDTAQASLRQLQAAVRNELPNPLQVAAFLQGADDAALDASAAVLKSLAGAPAAGGQQQVVTPPPIPNGDANAAASGGGQAGDMSMSDRIRAAAGRRVR